MILLKMKSIQSTHLIINYTPSSPASESAFSEPYPLWSNASTLHPLDAAYIAFLPSPSPGSRIFPGVSLAISEAKKPLGSLPYTK